TASPVYPSDLSTSNPTIWDWSFPNGNSIDSTLKNPTVTYTKPGRYNISLAVSDTFNNYSAITKTVTVLPRDTSFSGQWQYIGDRNATGGHVYTTATFQGQLYLAGDGNLNPCTWNGETFTSIRQG